MLVVILADRKYRMALTEEMNDIFHDSFSRCKSNPDFFRIFYEEFINSSAEVAAKFANIDMKRQQQMLQASIYMIMLASQGLDDARLYLDKVAEKHSHRGLDIHPELYDLWLTSLLSTVARTDPLWDLTIEKAWHDMMSYGIAYMQSRY